MDVHPLLGAPRAEVEQALGEPESERTVQFARAPGPRLLARYDLKRWKLTAVYEDAPKLVSSLTLFEELACDEDDERFDAFLDDASALLAAADEEELPACARTRQRLLRGENGR